MEKPLIITFELRADRLNKANWTISERGNDGGWFLAPMDEVAVAAVYPDEPNVIRMGNFLKKKAARVFLEEQICEWLSHEALHRVMFEIGETKASTRFDRKNGHGPLVMSGFNASQWS